MRRMPCICNAAFATGLLLLLATIGFDRLWLQPRGQAVMLSGVPSPLHIAGLTLSPLQTRIGEPAGGLRCIAQRDRSRCGGCPADRDWRSGSRVLSVNSRNKAVEYELEESATFALRTADGRNRSLRRPYGRCASCFNRKTPCSAAAVRPNCCARTCAANWWTVSSAASRPRDSADAGLPDKLQEHLARSSHLPTSSAAMNRCSWANAAMRSRAAARGRTYHREGPGGRRWIRLATIDRRSLCLLAVRGQEDHRRADSRWQTRCRGQQGVDRLLCRSTARHAAAGQHAQTRSSAAERQMVQGPGCARRGGAGLADRDPATARLDQAATAQCRHRTDGWWCRCWPSVSKGICWQPARRSKKLLLLHGPGRLDADQLEAAVADSSRYDVFELVDSALRGEVERSIRILDGLRAEGLAPSVVLWALHREVRNLAQISADVAKGQVPTRQSAGLACSASALPWSARTWAGCARRSGC